MKVLICFGTRPEWIKVKPLITALNKVGIETKTLKIKQHTTLLQDVHADVEVEIGEGNVGSTTNNRLDLVVSSIGKLPLSSFDTVDYTLVQGDTATAFVCALASFHRNIPVVHLEAGLRTYDQQNPYPEETYRQLISRIASIHLCPTEGNRRHLEAELVNGRIVVVGNTVLDNLNYLKPTVSLGDEVLVTLHRRENHDKMDRWFRAITDVAEMYPELRFTIPLHPNPAVQDHRDKLVGYNLKVIEPLEYSKFLERLAKCCMVISDSGGIQEECAFLGKRVIVCRRVTERPESVGKTSWLVEEPEQLVRRFEQLKDVTVKPSYVYGDGQACQKIAEYMKTLG